MDFVGGNPHVATGLTAANLRWAFQEPYIATGGPITWLSHMLDVEWFGLSPGAHHVTSVVLHTVASLALFGALSSATGAALPSAIVACLFAVHPLHVESVAWISERKDVLSAIFWFLTIGAYLRYVRRPGLSRYGLVVIAFALGLLSKPMIATLPLTLLLLDYWPLRRLSWEEPRHFGRLLLEKAPLAALSVVALALTLAAQAQIGAVAAVERVPLGTRAANACVAAMTYVRRMLWPTDLAVFYPYRDPIAPALWIGCALFLTVTTVLAIRVARRAPYVTTGWLWFLVTLAPVSGLVQVGGHAMADRFTYVPLVGVFVVLVWSGHALLERFGLDQRLGATVAGIAVALCVVAARAQVWHWENSVALWRHALDVTHDNGRAHANLGVALAQVGETERALDEYRSALAIQPTDPKTHNNLGLALVQQSQLAEAISHYRQAISLDSLYANAHNNLANALAEDGHSEEALAHHHEAIRLDPTNGLLHANLAITLGQMDRLGDAIASMREALRLDPRQAEGHYIAGVMLVQKQDPRGAVQQFAAALAIDPSLQKSAKRHLAELKARP